MSTDTVSNTPAVATTVKRIKVKKMVKDPVDIVEGAVAADAPVSDEKKKTTSKTNTANLDNILTKLMPHLKISEKDMKKLLENDLPTTSKFKKRRSKKSKEMPTRYSSPYIFFSKEQRPIVKESSPELSFTDITKKIAAIWRELVDKSVYEKMSADDRTRYTAAMVTYNELHPKVEEPVEIVVKEVKVKEVKATKAPKKAKAQKTETETSAETKTKVAKAPRTKKAKVTETAVAVEASA